MRITTETLLKIARDTVAQRTRSDRSLLAIYLTGSLLESEPLLGGRPTSTWYSSMTRR
jgi:hypothetical protein